ncbi:glucose-1-phosphate thymidylyltransferase [Candidatus Kryptobacter tengchongensis]|uniref:Glucose-1-phosphate thymidylyltransferase n=1 Tax=Kryptobacter tengchongensis TaxID=1643429 RepID=A0A916LHN6_KRYT1|nr:sugar phosphate nucleotidyltransferase [Candidatus Kryptobacter tengchongensis]CUS95972.1 glucose-1-phosphate thymidylyltransferase [Candidatus Kryptobacter tengchongensis]CUU09370.1 glucose-1-phosphate thymidylyltransferase [Candidatus Kryptobacter tengchongensis]
MKAIIPVAGIGTRLRPHTYTQPKVLLNVAGKPILGHIIDKLVENSIKDILLVIGHLGEKIKSYTVSSYPDVNFEFIEQKEPLGLGHAVYLAREFFEKDDEVLIILGDTIFDFDLSKFLKSKFTTIGVKPVDDPRRFGVVLLDGDNFAKKLVEKPTQPESNLAIVGIYLIKNPKLLKESLEEVVEGEIKTRGEYQLTDALQIMLNKGEKIKVFEIDGWYDCGKPETLLDTNKFLLEKNGMNFRRLGKLENVLLIPPVYISPTSKIENSIIGPYTTVSDGVEISYSIIRNSIIGDDAKIQNALLESSIVGSGAVVKGDYKRVNIGDSSEVEFY